MANHPDVGEQAPDFTLPSTQGEITLSKLRAKGAVLLVFYPGDDTPVCTKQLCNYRDNLSSFADLGVQVVALNPQSASEANTTYAITTTLRMIVAIAAPSTMSKAGLANVRSLVAVERQR